MQESVRATPARRAVGWWPRGCWLPALLPLVAAWPVAAAPTAGPALNVDPAPTAPYAYLVDLGSGRVLYARQPHWRFPPASLTKIMTAYVAFELIATGRLAPEQTFTVSPETNHRWAGVGTSMVLASGSRVTVDSLLTGVMTASANDAAVVLAEGIAGSVDRFTALMNAQAKALGLKDSHFATPNGWPDQGATYTSAADLARLSQAMLTRHPALYRRYVGRAAMDWHGTRLSSRNPLLGSVAGADGVKTGYTAQAGYGLVGSAQRGERRLIGVVAGLNSAAVRAAEGGALLEWGFATWQAKPLFAPRQTVAIARVQQGASRTVPLVAPRAYYLTLRAGEPARYKLAVRYRGPLPAPVRAGAEVAELLVVGPGGETQRLPLLAGREVAAAGFLARLRNGLLGLAGW